MNRVVTYLLLTSFITALSVGFSFYFIFGGSSPSYPTTSVSAPGSAPGQVTGYTQTLQCGPGFNHIALNVINSTTGIMSCNP